MGNMFIYETPKLKKPHMVLGFSGWMDGGEVSTGTVEYLKTKLKAKKFAEITPENFYIFNFPAPMELSSLFRPYTKIEEGIVKDFCFPKNEFFYVKKNDLILFLGKEPNIGWENYADCILELAQKFGVKKMYFAGSVAGPIPHTREPRVFSFVSKEQLKVKLKNYGVKFTDYEGPASIVTLLTKLSEDKDIEMINFVSEIPIYVQTRNPKCIEALVKRLIKLLDIDINIDDLHKMSNELEERLDRAIQEQPELSKQVRRLEEIYDREIFDDQMKDIEKWFKQRGITL